MSVKIGHASIDENRKIKGGAAGDQTAKEVCTRTWYDGGWQFVLRPRTSTLAEKSAKACERGCANSKIGYDQNQRNSLYTQAKKVKFDLSKITTKCETDCSAFMTVCAIAGGADINYGSNAPATSTMKSRFLESGDYEVLSASKYVDNDDYLKRGDILVKPGSHTVMVLENGSDVSYTLTQFIKDVQKVTGSKVDGKAGEETLENTVTVSKVKNNTHVVVKPIQKRLNSLGYNVGNADGKAGDKFDKGVKEFQEDKGCTVDGEVTAKKKTWKKLLGMN